MQPHEGAVTVPDRKAENLPILPGSRAQQRGNDVFLAVQDLHGLVIRGPPGAIWHEPVPERLVLSVVVVVVAINRDLVLDHLPVVSGPGKWRQHEQGSKVHFDLIAQVFYVVADRLSRVERQSNDVADMHQDVVVMPDLHHVYVFLRVILPFSDGLEVLSVHAFHSDEGEVASRLCRFLDEVRDAMGLGVRLHHELDVDAPIPQRDQPIENLSPHGIAREVVVGEEVEADPVCVVLLDCLQHQLRGAKTHLPALDIDNGAERTIERAPSAGVDRCHPLR